MDTLIPAGVSAATVATLLQLAKNSPLFPWINRDTGRLNAALSVILAGLTAFGLSYDYSFDQATGAFTLGFTGTVAGLIDGIAHWAGQWTAQHSFYKLILSPAECLGEIRAILKEALLNEPPQKKAEVPPVIPPLAPMPPAA
jgi:hypothetical protein